MIDPIDKRILKLLQRNAQITIKEIGQKINLSNTPIYERIKRMEKQGYIKKQVTLLNRQKLGKKLIVFCNVSLKQHSKEIGQQFVKDITSLEQVTECYNISGDYDFLLKVLVEDMEAYQDFVLNHLGSVENIGSAHSTFVMAEIKHTTEIPI